MPKLFGNFSPTCRSYKAPATVHKADGGVKGSEELLQLGREFKSTWSEAGALWKPACGSLESRLEQKALKTV